MDVYLPQKTERLRMNLHFVPHWELCTEILHVVVSTDLVPMTKTKVSCLDTSGASTTVLRYMPASAFALFMLTAKRIHK